MITLNKLLPTAFVAAALCALCIAFFDEPFARWLATRETYPAFWDEGIRLLEYPLGIEPYKWIGVYVLVGGSIVTLAIARLRPYAFAFLLVTVVHLLGRNISMWMKFGTGRLRPSQWLAKGGDSWWREGGFSFPSGHAILFASIVIPLAVAYPRARPLLAVVAFAMAARVAVGAHFLSDVLGGLAITAAITWLCAAALRRALPSLTPPTCRP